MESRKISQALVEDEFAVGGDIVDPVDGGKEWNEGEDFGVFAEHALDCAHGFAEAVEFALRIALGGLDHKPKGFGPCDGGGVEPEIEEELADAGDGEGAGYTDGFEPREIFFVEGKDELV